MGCITKLLISWNSSSRRISADRKPWPISHARTMLSSPGTRPSLWSSVVVVDDEEEDDDIEDDDMTPIAVCLLSYCFSVPFFLVAFLPPVNDNGALNNDGVLRPIFCSKAKRERESREWARSGAPFLAWASIIDSPSSPFWWEMF